MNKDMFFKVADAIEQDQKLSREMTFDMNQWAKRHTCGTSACVAGYCIAITNENLFKKIREIKSSSFSDAGLDPREWPAEAARSQMGLTEQEAKVLFTPTGMYGDINHSAEFVPDALRWMALNETIDWKEALSAAREVAECRLEHSATD